MDMQIILGARQTGKTTKLIEMCYEADQLGEVAYIICHSHEEAYRISQKAEAMGKPVRFPITYKETTEGLRGGYINKVFIDNVDLFVRTLFPLPIGAITINYDNHNNGSGQPL